MEFFLDFCGILLCVYPAFDSVRNTKCLIFDKRDSDHARHRED